MKWKKKRSIQKKIIGVPSRNKIKSFKNGDSSFSSKVYCAEITTGIKNESTVPATFRAYNWTETLQEGYLDGETYEFRLQPEQDKIV